jgi:hypothetical protein
MLFSWPFARHNTLSGIPDNSGIQKYLPLFSQIFSGYYKFDRYVIKITQI